MAPPGDTVTLSLDRFAAEARGVIVAAQALADERRHLQVEPLHVFASALARNPSVAEVLRSSGADPAEFSALMERALGGLPRSNEPAFLSPATLELLRRTEREAEREKREQILVQDVLNALSQELRGALGEILSAFRIGPGALRPHMSALRSRPRDEPAAAEPLAPTEYLRRMPAQDSNPGSVAVVGRAVELRRLLTVLVRSNKSHPLLVGEPGVGKRALVRLLAQRIAQGAVPDVLTRAGVFELELAAIAAGARLRGEVEDRMRKLLNDLRSRREPSVWFVHAIDQLFGGTGPLAGLPDLLRPVLERGELRLISTTTPDGLRKLHEKDPHFARLLTELNVDEPSPDQALEMVRAAAALLEEHHRVAIAEDAIASSVELSRRYLQERHLPDSAIDLLDESAAQRRLTIDSLPEAADFELRRFESLEAQLALDGDPREAERHPVRLRLQAEHRQLSPKVAETRKAAEARRQSRRKLLEVQADVAQQRAAQSELSPILQAKLAEAEREAEAVGAATKPPLVNAEDVAATLAAWTQIPVQRMMEGEADRLLRMDERLGERVIGQDHAVSSVARAVRRGRVGLRDPRRPIGSFLFLGPSGVGKTELAKALANLLFDDERALTRLDMSEFMERHMAQRLIGAPPGYADSEQGGFLTEAVRRRPYSVLLFDEVEKAHQDVFNLLLQLLDEGRLTDGRGRTADFSNTVVILTSNIGSDRVLATEPALFDSEPGREALRDVLLDKLREFFRPELLNRLEEVLVFRPLSRAHLQKIVDLELKNVSKLLDTRSITLQATDAAKARLVELGYEPALGARPLRRTILHHVQDPLAEALLAGKFLPNSQVTLDVAGDELVLRPQTDSPAQPSS
ncbi:MAG TPA: ATP-dependent Clp protease ATP-binding subunit [Polyangiaceae bacterium]|nr:ATP-dependent Clp protease ATP-binding subunit [Polyangiaceae bacterium]